MNDGSWKGAFVGQEKGDEGALTRAAVEVRSDIRMLEELYQRRAAEKKKVDAILNLMNTLKNRHLIQQLSTSGVIPKYGFPVDVVELELLNKQRQAERLELSRDLRIAIAEYAPESEIVAGKRAWKSYAIKRVPGCEWESFKYAICPECGLYQRHRVEEEEPIVECKGCGKSLTGHGSGSNKGTFIIPNFGFTTSLHEQPAKPGLFRPPRQHTTRVYFCTTEPWEERTDTLHIESGSYLIKATARPSSSLVVINPLPFKVCRNCGYAVRANTKGSGQHRNPYGEKCEGILTHYRLGHEFMTDVASIEIPDLLSTEDAWLSVLYALLEGAALAIGINRDDIDGCLYPYRGDKRNPALIIYDNVPGGAGHARRLLSEKSTILSAFRTAKQIVDECECGENTSCYECLRNYRNQYFHTRLSRGSAQEILKSIGV